MSRLAFPTRRAALAALLLSSGFALAQDKPPPTVDLVFFGTSSCPTCAGWKRFDYPKLAAAPGFQGVRFTEVTKAIRSDIPSASSFPPELAAYRDPIARSFHGAVGSPMFALLADGVVVDSWRGTARSNDEILAEIAKVNARP